MAARPQTLAMHMALPVLWQQGQNVSAVSAYVRSDTTVNFTLKHGQAYCFKMTVVNGNAMTPSFTVGNGDVLKTQFVAKIGNDYYYRVLCDRHAGPEHGAFIPPCRARTPSSIAR